MSITSIVSKSMAIVVGLSLSLGFPLAIDISMSISSIVSKSMAIVSTIVVGLGLSLGFPLAIDISMAISTIVSIPYSTIVEGVSLSLSFGVSNGAGRQGKENQHLHIGSCL